jgi:hypothetical protein
MTNPRLNRRTFLIQLAAGGVAGIGGYFLFPRTLKVCQAAPTENSSASPRPELRADIVFGRHAQMTSICYQSNSGNVRCAINRPGQVIVRNLDGAHTIEQISRALNVDLSLSPELDLAAPVAHFVARLGMLGFLARPFYATLYYENTQTYED